MDADEREIYYFMKSWQNEFLSAREICRRAGGKHRFRESAEWAKPALARMVDRGILETDNGGHYRLKPRPRRDPKKRWVSPQVAKILTQSGKNFSDTIILEDDLDSYYENL